MAIVFFSLSKISVSLSGYIVALDLRDERNLVCDLVREVIHFARYQDLVA